MTLQAILFFPVQEGEEVYVTLGGNVANRTISGLKPTDPLLRYWVVDQKETRTLIDRFKDERLAKILRWITGLPFGGNKADAR